MSYGSYDILNRFFFFLNMGLHFLQIQCNIPQQSSKNNCNCFLVYVYILILREVRGTSYELEAASKNKCFLTENFSMKDTSPLYAPVSVVSFVQSLRCTTVTDAVIEY